MSINLTAQVRPLQPETDEIIYLQTPRTTGEFDVPEEDSWDLAEEKAQQDATTNLPPAGVDIESASTNSSSDSSSVGSAASTNASATASATTPAASSATSKMTTAAPANVPATRGLRPGVIAALCATTTLVAIGNGIMFTLLATGDTPTNRAQHPSDIMAEEAFAAIAYLAALATGVAAVRYAIKAATTNS